MDSVGSDTGYETDHVPHIGERRFLPSYGKASALEDYAFLLVEAVEYRLDNDKDYQVPALAKEETDPAAFWPE